MQTDSYDTHARRPSIDVAVVMRREPVTGPMSRWQSARWVLVDVIPEGEPFLADLSDVGQAMLPPEEVVPVDAGGLPEARHWIFRHRRVTLFRDDAEGYFLNLTSPTPCFWVFWRSDDEWLVDGEPGAMPQIVTLSYHDAGRWLDAQEKVDQVPAPPAVVGWLQAFVDQHHQVEPKRRKRPESFRPLTDRFGQPVRISTDKLSRGRGGT
ncbi:DUF3305 domain-containing protein [Hydrogenophaga sp.]|uniref:DUF3305 domain-containing protein n=1 Tax=Hydrogenophaga sp. TaxID=1904254 RepID=UPI00347F9CD0